ncbi:MAG: hypothetical protein OCD01_06620 [Fibrobacterales bacterium]
MKFSLCIYRTGIVWFFLVLVVGCTNSRNTIGKKLDTLLQNDLKMIVAQQLNSVEKEHILEEPYYRVEDLRFFQGDTANLYAAYAEVSFFFYREITLKEVRKYRFNAQYNYWDRYEKKLRHFSESSKK